MILKKLKIPKNLESKRERKKKEKRKEKKEKRDPILNTN